MYIFISHSSNDASKAADICELLEKNGNKCFIAPRDIRSGYEYAEEIINGVDNADVMLLLLSKASNESPHVLREVERAVSKGLPVIVYKMEDVELTKSMEYFLMTHQWLNEKKGSYEELMKCIKDVENRLKAARSPENNTENSVTEKKEDNSPNTKINKKIIFLIVVAVALLVAGIVVFALFKKDDDTSDRENDTKIQEDNTTMQDEPRTQSESHTQSESLTQGEPETKGEPQTDIKTGDNITFGRYNDEDIVWRVLKISDDGKEAVLITKDIITMKAYDAAEGGRYGYDGDECYIKQDSEADTDLELQVKVRGNSEWKTSNLRTWLNSTKEVVNYEDHAPASTAMSELRNGYDNEPGFLYNFTEEEIAAILDTQVSTNGNALSEEKIITTTDKVFILSKDELKWFEEAGISMLAKPTAAALEQDKSQWYEVEYDSYGVEQYCWWLREPVEGTSGKCYMVGNGYYEENIWTKNVGLEGFGVRPVITVDLQADCIRAEK
ncbi:MAG: DUF6273 domain-containing protein [Butyrivibrio sp.]